MSRLAAKEKLQYYRTPEVIIEALARYLTTPTYVFTRLLDPCAGTGAALALLATRLKEQHEQTQNPLLSHAFTLETYGIEPELRRSREAFACLNHVLQASFFSTTLSNGEGADGGWQLAFVNPPYDVDTEVLERGRKTRLEINFLQRATLKLCPEGILVFVVPQRILKGAAPFLASAYEQITCLRFPDDVWRPDPQKDEWVPLYEQFEQVVLFAQKRRFQVPAPRDMVEQIQGWADAGRTLPQLSLSSQVSEVPIYFIPNAPRGAIRSFHAGSFDPDHAAALAVQVAPKTQRIQTGVWSKQEYFTARVPEGARRQVGIGVPMAPLKNAHLSVLAVAGIANQALLTGKDGRRVIVKGSARKVPIYSKYEDEDEIVEKMTDTFETALWCLDLDTGALIRVETGPVAGATFPVECESMSLVDFLDNFGASLTQQVAQAHPPRYDVDAHLPWVEDGWKHIKRQPLGKQRDAILATVTGFLKQDGTHGNMLDRTAPVAEMACGKSYLSLCSAFLADRYASGGADLAIKGIAREHLFPLVILCPPIMARKWKREAEQTLPNVRAVIVKRLGTPASVGESRKGYDEEETETGQEKHQDLQDFRAFDPDFTGTALSAIGCADRVVARIRHELAEWKEAYDQAHALGEKLPLKSCHIVIVTTSTAKLGKEWRPVYRLKVATRMDAQTKKKHILRDANGQPLTVPCCPSCFRAIKDERKVAQIKRIIEDIAPSGLRGTSTGDASYTFDCFLTEKEILGTRERRVKRFCDECGEALWQYCAEKVENWTPYSVWRPQKETLQALPLPDRERMSAVVTSTVRRRYPLGDYILKRYKGVFHLLIADEVHEGADGTALDFARQRLASACKRMMGLTGTLSNGYSASLFRLYYVLNPEVRARFGYHDVSRWIDLYGRRQTVQKTYKEADEEGRGSSSDRRVGKPIIKELAGFAPQGLEHVLPCSTFLELSDVVPHLPPYREEIREVDLGPIAFHYETFERETTQVIGRMLAKGDKSGLSAWWNGLMNYPNLPYLGWTFRTRWSTEVVKAPALPEDTLYPKERALVELVQREYDAGRRVLIYTENTGIYDIMPRLKKILETKVQSRTNTSLRVAVLRSTTVDPINREAWLEKQVEDGCDVVICNPKLVKVGLDLLAFPTIVYMSIPKSTSDLRQSSRRSLRPGQTKPVNVIFLVYPTMEWRLLSLMARKMKSSLMVEGKLPGEGLVSFGEHEEDDEQDVYVQLARDVLASLEQGMPTDRLQEAHDLQAIFTENAQIEREKNQTLGSQSEISIIEFDPIRVEPLQISVDFSPQPDDEQPVKQEVDTPVERVTIIHTSITTGKDPWADLRKKYLPEKKRRKKHAVSPDAPTLWSVPEGSSKETDDIHIDVSPPSKDVSLLSSATIEQLDLFAPVMDKPVVVFNGEYMLIKEAIDRLAGICDGAKKHDGAGFSGVDTKLGHLLACLPLDAWTPSSLYRAWKMVRKYRKQLAVLGIEYEKLPVPPVSEIEEEYRYIAELPQGDGVCIYFPYDEELVLACRRLPGATFVQTPMKHWQIRMTADAVSALQDFVERYRFVVTSSVRRLFETV